MENLHHLKAMTMSHFKDAQKYSDIDYGYRPTNRQKAKSATKHKFWCHFCDHGLVGEWGRCPWCGRKNATQKIKR